METFLLADFTEKFDNVKNRQVIIQYLLKERYQ